LAAAGPHLLLLQWQEQQVQVLQVPWDLWQPLCGTHCNLLQHQQQQQ
jgi:hypothetical protein